MDRVEPSAQSDRPALLSLSRRGIATGRSMALVANQSWPEDTQQSKGAICPQFVAVMLVERVHDAGPQLIGFPVSDINDLALTRDAVVGLEVVRVLEFEFGVRGNLGQMQREVHPIVAAQEAQAPPTFAVDVSLSSVQLSQSSYDHCPPSVSTRRCIFRRQL